MAVEMRAVSDDWGFSAPSLTRISAGIPPLGARNHCITSLHPSPFSLFLLNFFMLFRVRLNQCGQSSRNRTGETLPDRVDAISRQVRDGGRVIEYESQTERPEEKEEFRKKNSKSTNNGAGRRRGGGGGVKKDN